MLVLRFSNKTLLLCKKFFYLFFKKWNQVIVLCQQKWFNYVAVPNNTDVYWFVNADVHDATEKYTDILNHYIVSLSFSLNAYCSFCWVSLCPACSKLSPA